MNAEALQNGRLTQWKSSNNSMTIDKSMSAYHLDSSVFKRKRNALNKLRLQSASASKVQDVAHRAFHEYSNLIIGCVEVGVDSTIPTHDIPKILLGLEYLAANWKEHLPVFDTAGKLSDSLKANDVDLAISFFSSIADGSGGVALGTPTDAIAFSLLLMKFNTQNKSTKYKNMFLFYVGCIWGDLEESRLEVYAEMDRALNERELLDETISEAAGASQERSADPLKRM